MWQNIVVAAAIVASLAYAIVRVRRAWRCGKQQGVCASCPLHDSCSKH